MKLFRSARVLGLLSALAVGVAAVGPVWGPIAMAADAAAAWPAKPIRAVLPVPPGGVIDNTMRVVAEHLSSRLGQQRVIDNHPGANGAIGAQLVATAQPDGYTLLAAVDGTMMVSLNPKLFPNATVSTLRDLVPVTKLGDFGLVLVAHPSLKVRTLAQFIALGRQSGATYGFGTSGIGSTTHLAGEMLAQRTGVHLIHVPYKGGGQAMADVLGGQIPLVMTTVPTAQQFVKSGRLYGLAVASLARSAGLPEVGTYAENGVPDFNTPGWVGIFMPIATPKPIVDRMQQEFAAVLALPAVRAQYAEIGMEASGLASAAFTQEIRVGSERWAEVVARGKIDLQ